MRAEAERLGMHTVYVDFYRALTLAEVSRRIEEAYLSALAGAPRRAVVAITLLRIDSMLNALFGDRKRPLFDQARAIPLDPLRDDDLIEYIGVRFERADRDPGEALDALLELVRGHPQRAMLCAHHLWEQTPRGGTPADLETFERTLEAIDRETKETFEKLWDDLADKPNQRKVLAALANSEDTLYNRRTLERYGLEKGSAEAAVRALIGRGDVQRTEGGFLIVDPLLERWLRHG